MIFKRRINHIHSFDVSAAYPEDGIGYVKVLPIDWDWAGTVFGAADADEEMIVLIAAQVY